MCKTKNCIIQQTKDAVVFSLQRMSYNKKSGKYTCAACGNGLFNSKTKYDSDCGWPSFYKSKNNSVLLKKDFSYGINRTEIICNRCGSHLGQINQIRSKINKFLFYVFD